MGLASTNTTERKSVGKALHNFGMINKNLARVAAETFAAESEVFRTAANISRVQQASGDNTEAMFKAVEEYAIEASIAKVHGSETLAFAVDEGVQIFGGYGFMQEYPIEKAYRDARIQRIFEGTNEINRLIITGWLMKRAMAGQLALLPAIKRVMEEILEPQISSFDSDLPLGPERRLLSNLKKMSLFAAGVASQKHMQDLQEQQEISVNRSIRSRFDRHANAPVCWKSAQTSPRGNRSEAIAQQKRPTAPQPVTPCTKASAIPQELRCRIFAETVPLARTSERGPTRRSTLAGMRSENGRTS